LASGPQASPCEHTLPRDEHDWPMVPAALHFKVVHGFLPAASKPASFVPSAGIQRPARIREYGADHHDDRVGACRGAEAGAPRDGRKSCAARLGVPLAVIGGCGAVRSSAHIVQYLDGGMPPRMPRQQGSMTPSRQPGVLRISSLIRGAVVCGSIWVSVRPASADEESVLPKMSVNAPNPPFVAAVKTRFARVLLRPETDGPEIGLLREGATVAVTACKPDCASSHGWALIGSEGAVKLNLLDPQPIRSEAPTAPTAENSWYGRVGKSAIRIFKEPRLDGPLLARNQTNLEMAFWPNADLRMRGWFERIESGFVPVRRVQFLTPSRFQGEVQPKLPLAFMVRNLRATGSGPTSGWRRYDRIPVRSIDKRGVTTDSGPLPRNAVRIVTLHSPPPAMAPPGRRDSRSRARSSGRARASGTTICS
jgi:hypothetical protein